jgi:hypothetical protein
LFETSRILVFITPVAVAIHPGHLSWLVSSFESCLYFGKLGWMNIALEWIGVENCHIGLLVVRECDWWIGRWICQIWMIGEWAARCGGEWDITFWPYFWNLLFWQWGCFKPNWIFHSLNDQSSALLQSADSNRQQNNQRCNTCREKSHFHGTGRSEIFFNTSSPDASTPTL